MSIKVKTKTHNLLIAGLLAAFLCFGAGNAVHAVEQHEFTDSRGVTWVYEVDETGDTPVVTIGFKAAPADATTVVVPSLDEVMAASSQSGLDTYFVDGILEDETTATIPTGLTKVDMTNTQKVQLRSLSPLFKNNLANNSEVELVFGDNMVIAGDSTDDGAFAGLHVKMSGFDKLKYIGWRAFEDVVFNANNTSASISTQQTLGGYVFAGTNLKTLNINTKEVGEAICKDCSELTSLTLGDNVETLYGRVFQNTPNLSLEFDSKNIKSIGELAFADSGVSKVTFKPTLETIDHGAFMNNNLGSVDFSNSTPVVSTSSFYNTNLSSVNLGNLAIIGDLAFAKNNITEISFPKSIRRLGAAIFAANPIKTVTVKFDTMAVSDYDSNGLVTDFRVLLSGSQGTVCDGMLGICSNRLGTDASEYVETLNVIAPYGANDTVITPRRSISDQGYQNGMADKKNVISSLFFQDFAHNLKTLNIGEGYEYIDSQAFMWTCSSAFSLNCGSFPTFDSTNGGSGPSSVSFPSTLKGFGINSFMWTLNNPSLVLASLPADIEYIGTQAFAGNSHLTITNFDHSKLKYVGVSAFNTTNIINLTIREATERIENAAFIGSRKMKTLTFDTDIFGKRSDGQKIIISTWETVFVGNTNGGYLGVVPYDYDKTNYWYQYNYHLDKIKFTEKSVTPPDTPDLFANYVDEFDASATKWTETKYNAFHRMKVKTFKLPSTLTKIAENSFMRAEITNPIVLPSGITEIGTRAFWGTVTSDDRNFTQYPEYYPNAVIASEEEIKAPVANLPSTITKIGDFAFYMDEGFTADVDLPNLTYLGEEAFYGTNVRDVVLGNKITTLGSNAFYNAPALRNVTINVNLHDKNIHSNAEDMNKYGSFVATFGAGQKLGVVKFGEHAGEPHTAEGTAEYICNGFASCDKKWAYFYGLKAEKLDLNDTNWKALSASMLQEAKVDEIILPHALESIGNDAFYEAALGDVAIPDTLKQIWPEAFQWAKATISGLPEGLTHIWNSAFYGASVIDELVIPSTVTFIGPSAFNAGDNDNVNYNKVTIKPNLTYENTAGQAIFQAFWGSKVHELVIESEMLPTLAANNGEPEFHGMKMTKVTITKLPTIPANAFEYCQKLQLVVADEDTALRDIRKEAFLAAKELNEIQFAPELKNEVVMIGQRAFKGTAFETMGDETTDFDLTAAKFNGIDGYAFSGMPKLRTVSVPRTFTNATIPEATFYNNPELEEATIDYKITLMGNAAFANDNKLKRIFIWGNTVVLDENLPGYVAPSGGMGADDEFEPLPEEPEFGPTIPEGTDIYAYSVSPTKEYANYSGRKSFEGEFYPLDEVLYITSNKPLVKLNSEEDDFDKSNLTVYAMRRDGLIMESEEWGTYDGNVYPRSSSDRTFEKMEPTIAENPEFGTIWDTPVPIDELDFGNENFAAINFQMRDNGNGHVELVNIIYTDKFTGGKPDTDVEPYRPESAPVTLDQIVSYAAIFLGCATVIVGISLMRARSRRA